MTLQEAVERYGLCLRDEHSVETRQGYGHSLRFFMDWLEGDGQPRFGLTRDSHVQDVNNREVFRAYRAWLERRPACQRVKGDDGKWRWEHVTTGETANPNSCRRYEHAVRGLWNFLCNTGDKGMFPPVLTNNESAVIPMTKKAPQKVYVPTDEEMLALLDACDRLATDREAALARCVWHILRAGALRSRKEMCALLVSDYDPRGMSLTVRDGKGGKPRIQPIDAECGAAIDAWLAIRGPYEPLPRTLEDGRVVHDTRDYLLTVDKRRRLYDDGLTGLFRRLRRAAGLKGAAATQLTPRSIRVHTAQRVDRALGLGAACAVLGHTKANGAPNTQQTLHYLRRDNEAAREAVPHLSIRRPGGPPSQSQVRRPLWVVENR